MTLGMGTHLLIDGTTRRPLQFHTVRRFLDLCPNVIGMTPITYPVVYAGESGHWAGYVLIAESHIAVHSRDTQVWVDVFSCKEFDKDIAIQEAAERLGLVDLHHQSMQRGWMAHEVAYA